MSDRKEYIERGAVERMLENAQIISDGEYSGYCTEDISLDEIPTADVVEVVRCRDCKHKVNFQNRIMCDRNARYSTVRSEWYGLTATDNDNYCAYGERKDGADSD